MAAVGDTVLNLTRPEIEPTTSRTDLDVFTHYINRPVPFNKLTPSSYTKKSAKALDFFTEANNKSLTKSLTNHITEDSRFNSRFNLFHRIYNNDKKNAIT